MTESYQQFRRYFSLNRIQAVIVPAMRKAWLASGLLCPACQNPFPPVDLSAGFRLRCPACEADLIIGFSHDWLCPLISVTGGLIAAYAQRLDGCQFVIGASIYSIIFLVVCACVLLPRLPVKMQLARDPVQGLRIPK